MYPMFLRQFVRNFIYEFIGQFLISNTNHTILRQFKYMYDLTFISPYIIKLHDMV